MENPNPSDHTPNDEAAAGEALAEVEGLRLEREKWTAEKIQLEQKVQSLSAESDQAQQKIEGLNQQLADLREKELEPLKSSLAQEKSRSESVQEELQDVICQKDEANTHRAGLELDVQRLRDELGRLQDELKAAHAAGMDAQRETGESHRQLDEALRRLDGMQEELTAEHHKVEALLAALRRITSHRWYRLWDNFRRILGRPPLVGSRQDPLGIKSGMPM